MSGVRTLKNGARTGVSLRKSIAFDVPDPVNPANLSAEARNVLAGRARLLDSTEKQHVFRHIHATSGARGNFLPQIDSS